MTEKELLVLQWCRIIFLMLMSGYGGWWLNSRRFKYLRQRIIDLGTENVRLKDRLSKIEGERRDWA